MDAEPYSITHECRAHSRPGSAPPGSRLALASTVESGPYEGCALGTNPFQGGVAMKVKPVVFSSTMKMEYDTLRIDCCANEALK
jgi:hypothetical protein